MTFVAPTALWGLLALPVLAAMYVFVMWRRARMHTSALTTVATPRSRRRHVPACLFLAACGLLLFSLARPEANLTLPTRTGQIMLAFDTSNSMIAADVEPTRLDVAKQIARDFVDAQPGSVQIGVVSFTNGGLVVQPPTSAQAEVNAAIDRLQTDGGTSIGEGIFAALTAIADEPIELDPATLADQGAVLDIGQFSNAAIIVFTDGEDIGGADPVELAQIASNAGVPVYTVGIGTTRGTVVALDGFSIATALDEEVLADIAESTGGAYFLAADDPELTGIFDAIDRSFEQQGERIEITGLLSGLAMLVIIVAGSLSLRWFGRV